MREEAMLLLADLLHVSQGELEEALRSTSGYQRRFKPKRNGRGMRVFDVPPDPLKKIQKCILRRILYKFDLPFGIFHGFLPGKSIVTNAQIHSLALHPRYWLKIDLRDAFPSVREDHFRSLIRDLLESLDNFKIWRRAKVAKMLHRRYEHEHSDFGEDISLEYCLVCPYRQKIIDDVQRSHQIPFPILSKMFRRFSRFSPIFREFYWTWIHQSDISQDQPSLWDMSAFGFEALLCETFELLLQLTFHEGKLPQGTPSSGYLLNLILNCSGLATKLKSLASALSPECWDRFTFTVYADDFNFVSDQSFGERPFAARGDMRTVKGMIMATIEESGWFRINPEKTRNFDFMSGCPLVTGLRVQRKKFGLSKRQICWLRSFLHHARNNPDPKIQAQVHGWRAYLHMIYGENLPSQLKLKPLSIKKK